MVPSGLKATAEGAGEGPAEHGGHTQVGGGNKRSDSKICCQNAAARLCAASLPPPHRHPPCTQSAGTPHLRTRVDGAKMSARVCKLLCKDLVEEARLKVASLGRGGGHGRRILAATNQHVVKDGGHGGGVDGGSRLVGLQNLKRLHGRRRWQEGRRVKLNSRRVRLTLPHLPAAACSTIATAPATPQPPSHKRGDASPCPPLHLPLPPSPPASPPAWRCGLWML